MTTNEALEQRLKRLEESHRNHKHKGQALDQTEQLESNDSDSSSSISPSASIPEFDIGLNSFIDIINYPSLSGWTTVSTGGTATSYSAELLLQAAGGGPNGIFVYQKGQYNIVEIGKEIIVEWVINDITNSGGIQNAYLYMTWGNDTPTTIQEHFGFHIVDNKIYATNADGVNQNETDTGIQVINSGVVGYIQTRLKAIYTPGLNVRFYINEVLVSTHTTNLPASANSFRLNLGITTGNISTEDLFLGRILIQKEY